jgi:hypothetical protein
VVDRETGAPGKGLDVRYVLRLYDSVSPLSTLEHGLEVGKPVRDAEQNRRTGGLVRVPTFYAGGRAVHRDLSSHHGERRGTRRGFGCVREVNKDGISCGFLGRSYARLQQREAVGPRSDGDVHHGTTFGGSVFGTADRKKVFRPPPGSWKLALDEVPKPRIRPARRYDLPDVLAQGVQDRLHRRPLIQVSQPCGTVQDQEAE